MANVYDLLEHTIFCGVLDDYSPGNTSPGTTHRGTINRLDYSMVELFTESYFAGRLWQLFIGNYLSENLHANAGRRLEVVQFVVAQA